MKFRLVEAINETRIVQMQVPILISTDPVYNDNYVQSKQFENDIKKGIDILNVKILQNINMNISYFKQQLKSSEFSVKFIEFSEPFLIYEVEVDPEVEAENILKFVKRYLKGSEEIYNNDFDITLKLSTVLDKIQMI